MKRWEMSNYGLNNLLLVDVPIPEPRSGEVLVKVGAVSLNYRDRLVIENGQGAPLRFPFCPGSDLAGTVIAIGDAVERFQVGERVVSTFFPDWIDGLAPGNARTPDYGALGGAHQGVLSEYVVLPESGLVAAPKSLTLSEASTLPCAGLPAWFSLVEHGALKPGMSVLIQGTGGVALFALQIAKAYGAEVYVTSGSVEKLERVKALGADHVIDRLAEDWVAAVHRLSADRGIDHIVELVGGANIARSLDAVAVGGRISIIGVLDGLEIAGAAPTLILKAATLQGIRAGHRRSLENFVRAIDVVGIKPVIDGSYRMEELHAALERLSHGPFGKVVIELDR